MPLPSLPTAIARLITAMVLGVVTPHLPASNLPVLSVQTPSVPPPVTGTYPTTAARPAGAAAGSAGAAAAWRWPLDGPRMLLRPYVAPATRYSAGHRGVDIGVASPTTSGTAVYAPAAGIVHFSGVVVDRPVLSIRHGSGLISSFEPVSSELTAGEQVRAGQEVGRLQAGHCSRPCLHLGVRLHGEYLSPLNFLGGIPHSVLLPTRPIAAAAGR